VDDWQSILRSEFDAEEGSLLLKIRCDLAWDVDAFDRLVAAMEACCRAKVHERLVERWIAEGFWYVSWFVKDWTTHPNFPKWRTEEYYQAAYEYLDGLAFWFFFDEAPWTDDGVQARAELSRLREIRTTNHLKD